MLSGGAAVPERFFARLVDGHLVVIDLWRQEMRVLNPSAAVLWLSLSLGACTPDRLADILAEQAGAAATGQIVRDVAACLTEWRELGWIREGGAGCVRLADDMPAPRQPGVATAVQPGDPLCHAVPDTGTQTFAIRLLHGAARVRLGSVADPIDPDLIPRLCAVLSGFPVQDGDAAAADLRFIVGGDRIWIDTAEGLVWTTISNDALSHLVYSLFLAADPGRRPLATIHAAAVGRAGRGLVLMPGLSGCGKSTLTAGLVARGWTYGGDDIIALSDTDPPAVLPFATAASVKPGSWDLLSREYPVLPSLPITPYAGKQARFLPLPLACHVGSAFADRVPVALVFPRFDAAGGTGLEPISTLDALLRLVVCGFTTGDRLEPARLEPLFDLLEGLPKYHLAFNCLEAAEAALEPLVS